MTTEKATFSTIILEILLEHQDNLSAEHKKLLAEKNWLCINERCVSPQNILTLTSKDLRVHLEEIIELSEGEYIGDSKLPIGVKASLSKLRLFTAFGADDIVHFILSKPHPHLNAHIICDALHLLHKNQKLAEDVRHRVQTVAWLLDKSNNPLTPSSVIHYPSIKEKIEEILALNTKSKYISSSQLSPIISKHECFQGLSEQKNFFIRDQQALEIIGELLKPLSDYCLGTFSEEEFPLEEFWNVFKMLLQKFYQSGRSLRH